VQVIEKKESFAPITLYFLPVVALLLGHWVLVRLDAYQVQHSDSFMHLIGGVALGIAWLGVLGLARLMGICKSVTPMIEYTVIVVGVVIGAICWEILEWQLDKTVGTRWFGSPTDTAKDLILGTLGSIVLVVWRRRLRNLQVAEVPLQSGDSDAVEQSADE